MKILNAPLKPAAKIALTQACFFNNIAKLLFESTAHEMQGTGKAAMNMNANRCMANEKDVMAKCVDEATRAHFREQITTGDTLQFGHIITTMLAMQPAQRDLAEKLIDAIGRGEAIEFTNG